jgi:hypothetical protein
MSTPDQTPIIDWDTPLTPAGVTSRDWDPAYALLRQPSGWSRHTFDLYWVHVMFLRYFRQRPSCLGEWRTAARWAAVVKFMARPGDPTPPEGLEFVVTKFLNRAPNQIGSANPWRVETRYIERANTFAASTEYTLLKIPPPVKWCEAAQTAWRVAQAELERAKAADPGLDDQNAAPLPAPSPNTKPINPRPFSSETLSHSELVWMWADDKIHRAGSAEELAEAIGVSVETLEPNEQLNTEQTEGVGGYGERGRAGVRHR